MFELPPEVTKLAPGAVGSFFSMLWIKEPWPRKLAMFLAGSALARFGTLNVSHFTGLSEGFTGFLLGLFGMAIVAKLFQSWERFDIGATMTEFIRQRLGLPPKGP